MNNHSTNAAQRRENDHINSASAHDWEVWRKLRKSRHPYVIQQARRSITPNIPAAVSDDGFSSDQRSRKARKLTARLWAIEDHAAASGHPLVMVTASAGNHDPASLYTSAGAWAKAAARELCGDLPHFWKAEFGPDAGIHTHIVVSEAAAARAHALGYHVRPVDSVYRTALYLSKPADTRAARANYKRLQDVDDHAAAVVTYWQARAARIEATKNPRANLPALHGFTGVSQWMLEVTPYPVAEVVSYTELMEWYERQVIDTVGTPCEQRVDQRHRHRVTALLVNERVVKVTRPNRATRRTTRSSSHRSKVKPQRSGPIHGDLQRRQRQVIDQHPAHGHIKHLEAHAASLDPPTRKQHIGSHTSSNRAA